MKNKKTLKIIAILIAVLVVVVLGWNFETRTGNNQNVDDTSPIDTEILGNREDLVSFSVSPGDKVSGVLAVAGSVKGGYFFEGNIQINILDSNKKLLRSGNGNAKTDWMTSAPVGFDAVLDFTKLKKGPAYIEIHNDNASGLPENDKSVIIPVIIN